MRAVSPSWPYIPFVWSHRTEPTSSATLLILVDPAWSGMTVMISAWFIGTFRAPVHRKGCPKASMASSSRQVTVPVPRQVEIAPDELRAHGGSGFQGGRTFAAYVARHPAATGPAATGHTAAGHRNEAAPAQFVIEKGIRCLGGIPKTPWARQWV